MAKRKPRRVILQFLDDGDAIDIVPGPGVSTDEMNHALSTFILRHVESGAIQVVGPDGKPRTPAFVDVHHPHAAPTQGVN